MANANKTKASDIDFSASTGWASSSFLRGDGTFSPLSIIGAANFVPKFTGVNSIGNSTISDTAGVVTMGSNFNWNGTNTLEINGDIKFTARNEYLYFIDKGVSIQRPTGTDTISILGADVIIKSSVTGTSIYTADYFSIYKEDGSGLFVHVEPDNKSFNIGFGTPVTSAVLNIDTTDGALLLPRMNTAQMNALTPSNGMLIYNNQTNKFVGYENGSWVNLI